MLLYLDTTDNDVVEMVLVRPDGKEIKEKYVSLRTAENFAGVIKKFLAKNKLELSDITKIAVKQGAGYFSRVRSGAVLANALAYALKIRVVPVTGSVNFRKLRAVSGQSMIKPVYSRKPNITKSKNVYGRHKILR